MPEEPQQFTLHAEAAGEVISGTPGDSDEDEDEDRG